MYFAALIYNNLFIQLVMYVSDVFCNKTPEHWQGILLQKCLFFFLVLFLRKAKIPFNFANYNTEEE